MTRVSARRLVATVGKRVSKASRHGIRMSRLVHDRRSGPPRGRDEVTVRTWRVSWDESDDFFDCPTSNYMGVLRRAWKRRLPKTLGHVPAPCRQPLPPARQPDVRGTCVFEACIAWRGHWQPWQAIRSTEEWASMGNGRSLDAARPRGILKP